MLGLSKNSLRWLTTGIHFQTPTIVVRPDHLPLCFGWVQPKRRWRNDFLRTFITTRGAVLSFSELDVVLIVCNGKMYLQWLKRCLKPQISELLCTHCEQMCAVDVFVVSCHPYWTVALDELTENGLKKVSCEVVCVTGQTWVSVFSWWDWDSGGGIAWEMLLWFFPPPTFRKVRSGMPHIRQGNQRCWASDPFWSRILPDLFSLPLGGSIDSTSLLLIRKISGRMNISISFASFVICELAWYYPYVIFILGENYGFGFV